MAFKYLRKLYFRRTYNNFVILKRFTSTENNVLFESYINKGIITLNRNTALNGLNLSMAEKLLPIFKMCETSKSCVFIKSNGKAFCVGGDIRALIEANKRGYVYSHHFAKSVYKLLVLVGSYKIPYIPIINGMVMGSGAGLSMHGSHIIGTENTIFAMPETTIGFFTDSGGSYFMPRLKGKLGFYLALTGRKLKGSDALKAGIITHFVKSENLNLLEQCLLHSEDINGVLEEFSVKENCFNGHFSLEENLDQIDKCFNAHSVEEIFEKLKEDGSSWANETLSVLQQVSPTSLKISLKILNIGAEQNLNDCLKMEFRVAMNCLKEKDFYEGVRAVLIDKDNSPNWSPNKLTRVTEEIVERHFRKLSDELEL